VYRGALFRGGRRIAAFGLVSTSGTTPDDDAEKENDDHE
jgi:hypothetical protein